MSWRRPHGDGVVLQIMVRPRAARTDQSGVQGDWLRVQLTAPPVGGAANVALIAFLSERLAVRKGDLEIIAGATGRRKLVLVRGKTVDDVAHLGR
jgi:uncharacterized protein (TIGR00251 family)